MSSRLRVFGVALLVLWRVLCVFAVGVVCRRFGLRVLFLILLFKKTKTYGYAARCACHHGGWRFGAGRGRRLPPCKSERR